MEQKSIIGCIGCGMMGGSLLRAVAKKISGKNLRFFDIDIEKTINLAKELGGESLSSLKDVIAQSDYIFLAVKPVFMQSVLEEIASFLSEKEAQEKTFISIAAGLRIGMLREMSQRRLYNFVRLMPNLPASVMAGMIALARDKENVLITDDYSERVAFVKDFLSEAGKIEEVPETLMDAVTAVSGSGPAYGFMFIEALADAAVKLGMPRNQAYVYAAQTLKGAAEMVLQTGTHPAMLKDGVCSPAGTTIAAVAKLEECGFRNAVIAATEAAYEKSVSLGKN